MLLITLLDDNKAKSPIIVAYLRKRDVVLLHCYNSASATTMETSYVTIYTIGPLFQCLFCIAVSRGGLLVP
jgi:hypothetical protein